MDIVQVVIAGAVGLPVGSVLNRLIVREPGYVITDPKDLPEGADESLLDELEPVPDLDDVPFLALVRPGTWWRRWFPITEVVTASLFGLTAHQLGSAAATLAVLVLVAALVTLAAIDFRVYRLPDRINFPAMAAGFAAIVVASLWLDVPGAIVGAAFGGFSYAAVLFLAHIAYPRGMGWGDVKLAWLMGFYLGWFGWTSGAVVDQLIGSLQFVLLGAAFGSMIGRGHRWRVRADPAVGQGRVPVRPLARHGLPRRGPVGRSAALKPSSTTASPLYAPRDAALPDRR